MVEVRGEVEEKVSECGEGKRGVKE